MQCRAGKPAQEQARHRFTRVLATCKSTTPSAVISSSGVMSLSDVLREPRTSDTSAAEDRATRSNQVEAALAAVFAHALATVAALPAAVAAELTADPADSAAVPTEPLICHIPAGGRVQDIARKSIERRSKKKRKAKEEKKKKQKKRKKLTNK